MNTKNTFLEFKTDENFAELLEQFDTSSLKPGTIVTGKIIRIVNDHAVVDVGLKFDGIVSMSEFKYSNTDVQIGDEVEFCIQIFESYRSKMVLSHTQVIKMRRWDELKELLENDQIVEGLIFARVKGGLAVDLNGIIGFLPGSQVDVRPIKDVSSIANISQPFKILKMDDSQGNVVVSRRAILEETRATEREKLLDSIKEFDIVQGIVKNITDYGVFVDLGSVDGLLHITDISWNRISHPSEILSLGQEIEVQITKIDPKTKRISLGMKQLSGNPWSSNPDGFLSKYQNGMEIKGTVTNITDYGIFVQIVNEIEGLVHTSEISWSKNSGHPRTLVNTGQEITVKILEIDEKKQRISLSMKRCFPNPWQEFADNNQIGNTIDAEIHNIADFGLFIKLQNNIDGLVHSSDLSWTESGNVAIKKYSQGQKIQAKILDINVEKERIALGIKQLSNDPLPDLFTPDKLHSTISVIVSNISNDGIQVKVEDKLEVFIHRSELALEKSEQKPLNFTVGDKIDVKITRLNIKDRMIDLSIKQLEFDINKQAIKNYGSVDSGASLGGILGIAMDNAIDNNDSEENTDIKTKKETNSDSE